MTELPAEIARKLPRYPSVAAVLVGWLGRDAGFPGQQVGSLLLYDVIMGLATSPEKINAICADAINDAAAALNRALQSQPRSFYLPMKTAHGLINTLP